MWKRADLRDHNTLRATLPQGLGGTKRDQACNRRNGMRKFGRSYTGCFARWASSNSLSRSGAWSAMKWPTPGRTSNR
jgi:hypothetical protein